MNYIKELKIDNLNLFFSIKELNEINVGKLITNFEKDHLKKYKDKILEKDFIIDSILRSDSKINFISLLNEQEVLNTNSPLAVLYYAQDVINRPFPQGEDLIIKDPKIAFKYVDSVIRKAWPKGEDIISQDAESSYNYARYIIRKPFTKGETIISQDSDVAFSYAYDVIGKRWREGEKAISMDPLNSLSYATKIIKGPWEQGESTIMNSNFRSDYLDFLKHKGYDTSELKRKYS